MHPPATPAPRRFLPAQSRQQNTPARQSGDFQQPLQGTDDLLPRGDAHNQFAITPRFSSSRFRPPQKRSDQSEPTPIRSLTHGSTQPTEDVLDSSPSDSGEEDVMLLDEVAAESSWSDDLALSPKRRRLSDSVPAAHTDTASENFARPLQPASLYRQREMTTKQRFIPSSARSSIPTPARLGAPSFTSPSLRDHEDGPNQPLPDAFSPHRQGDRYIAGGMAKMLQQWVLETGQTALHARRADQTYAMKIVINVVELESEAVTLLLGSSEDDEKINVVLINDSTRRHRPQQPTVVSDMTLGLKEPCWPLALATRHWVVCVDWKILD
ncbi:hypothetical protein AMS68_005527 [Peltaster fructicola]|uniref:Uncharacterized protein n=1 Tax=Peltaster fructicola TaxID=286661 RepID=A0A6H0Y030_9PEZI|nr:hypothetical protein AMS68_005527 [Peltaster fructicola]